MLKVSLYINAYHNNNCDDIAIFYYNFNSAEPDLAADLKETFYNETVDAFEVLFEGLIEDSWENEFMALSHHSEYMYENTQLQHFRCEPKILERCL